MTTKLVFNIHIECKSYNRVYAMTYEVGVYNENIELSKKIQGNVLKYLSVGDNLDEILDEMFGVDNCFVKGGDNNG
jgi:hypothetical protein